VDLKLERVSKRDRRLNNLDYIFDDGKVRTGIQIVDSQEYNNCKFEAGETDHDFDHIALIVERDGVVDICLLMRPDEAMAIARVLISACWAHDITALEDTP
jgi:hypothetical protein